MGEKIILMIIQVNEGKIFFFKKRGEHVEKFASDQMHNNQASFFGINRAAVEGFYVTLFTGRRK